MRRALILFFILSFIGCTHKAPVKLAESSEFMSRDEVLEEMNAFTEESVMDEPLTDEEKNRENNLIPDEEFLDDIPEEEESFLEKTIKDDAPKDIDLRSRDTKIKSQDNGKCTAFSLIAGLESTLQKDGAIAGLDLSEWHLWSKYKLYSASAAIKAAQKHRVADEKDYKQYGKPRPGILGHTLLTKQNHIGDNFTDMVEALAKGHVVYLAMKTPREMLKCNKVISPFSAAAGGGHALLIVGYYLDEKNKPIAILKNSWGAKCGDKGYQYLSMSLCNKQGFYCTMWSLEGVDKLSKVSYR